MTRSLTIEEVVRLHTMLIEQSGGSEGIRDHGALESCVAQPHASFGGELLYPDLVSQAAALGHALVCNHPFVDGNKRIGHAAKEVFLVLNGMEIQAHVDEQESLVLSLASGKITRGALTEWLNDKADSLI